MDWEAIFHGSRREVSTVIIGCEVDFRSRKRISNEEGPTLIRRLKDYSNLSYESEVTIGVNENALKGWLRGNSKRTVETILPIKPNP